MYGLRSFQQGTTLRVDTWDCGSIQIDTSFAHCDWRDTCMHWSTIAMLLFFPSLTCAHAYAKASLCVQGQSQVHRVMKHETQTCICSIELRELIFQGPRFAHIDALGALSRLRVGVPHAFLRAHEVPNWRVPYIVASQLLYRKVARTLRFHLNPREDKGYIVARNIYINFLMQRDPSH